MDELIRLENLLKEKKKEYQDVLLELAKVKLQMRVDKINNAIHDDVAVEIPQGSKYFPVVRVEMPAKVTLCDQFSADQRVNVVYLKEGEENTKFMDVHKILI